MIRTAFILGAGLGTRLRPLTEECPKPLLPVGGRPLITYAMDHCLTIGVERFIVNTHHCPAAYDRAFPERSWRGWPILFRHEPVLLDTAGGLKNIEDLLEDEPLLVYNGDILSDLPLGRLLEAHGLGKKEVTLALRHRGPVTNVALDAEGAVCDIRGLLGNPGIRCCQFTGIYVVEKRILRRLTPGKVESVVPVFAAMIREAPGSLGSVVIDGGTWQDIGDPEAYALIEQARSRLRYEGDDQKRATAGKETASPDSLPGDGPGNAAAAFVRTTLGLSAETGITLAPVGQGGSDRDYFRGSAPGRDPFILMLYGRLREENNYYAEIARFLKGIGVAVPAVFGHDPAQGLLLMEDLGDEDLFSLRDAPWELRRDLYAKTIRLAALLHAFPAERVPSDLRLMPGFGLELYRWERDYFLEQCVGKVCGIALSADEGEALEMELEALARRLIETPLVLIHRDLQSQNVMVQNGEPVLIDFQGMRPGSPFYDLGSLLYDPYVEIGEELRTSLLRSYYDLAGLSTGWAEFRELFLIGSAQRLMQALGAYGFLGLGKGKRHFLDHIPRALDCLISVAEEAGSLPRLHALARRCRAGLERN
jgi:aminoglycoside/choline kinase family phosphotransferase/choline kinase